MGDEEEIQEQEMPIEYDEGTHETQLQDEDAFDDYDDEVYDDDEFTDEDDFDWEDEDEGDYPEPQEEYYDDFGELDEE